MNRFRNVLLRKCKSLSRSLSRSSSYRNLRSMSTREHVVAGGDGGIVGGGDSKAVSAGGDGAVVFVGSSRRYVISNKHLSHPLIAALIDDDVPAAAAGDGKEGGGGGGVVERRRSTSAATTTSSSTKPIAVNCEVVLFDHLLWMLDNAVDLRAGGDGDDDDAAMRELAQLYAY